jgi:hypothetical protein
VSADHALLAALVAWWHRHRQRDDLVAELRREIARLERLLDDCYRRESER